MGVHTQTSLKNEQQSPKHSTFSVIIVGIMPVRLIKIIIKKVVQKEKTTKMKNHQKCPSQCWKKNAIVAVNPVIIHWRVILKIKFQKKIGPSTRQSARNHQKHQAFTLK
jgi:hypothetical protein